MPAEPQTEIRRMTISHAEFLRSLTPLGKFYQYRIDEDETCIVIRDGLREVQVRLGPETAQRLGALHMPMTEVQLIYHGFNRAELERFRERFDLCFRRGGG